MSISRSTIFLLLISSFIQCDSQVDSHRMLAEWEEQKGIFVNYAGNPNDAENSEKVHRVCREIIRELSAVTTVYVLINEEYKQDSLLQLFSNAGIHTSNVILLPVFKLFSMGVPRDYGPMIVKNKKGNNEIARFHWDYVGADFVNPDSSWSKEREFIRAKYFDQMTSLLEMGIQRTRLTLEGGEIESNGMGSALLVDSFNLPRNPQLNKEQIEGLLQSSLGVKNTIWLREGVAEDVGAGSKANIVGDIYGYGVGGHVDEFARFVNQNTIFLAMPTLEEADLDPIKRISFDRMKVNAAILESSRDQDGKPWNLVYIPVPDVVAESYVIDTVNYKFPVSALRHDFPHWMHGDTIRFMPAVSYLNFLIFNQLVLIPKYWRTGFSQTCKEKDEEVRRIFAAHFPDKTIVQIDTWGMNRVGGGIHCWTQQIPSDQTGIMR